MLSGFLSILEIGANLPVDGGGGTNCQSPFGNPRPQKPITCPTRGKVYGSRAQGTYMKILAQEVSMTPKFLLRAVQIAILSVAIATPARANQLQTDATEIVIGIVAVTAAIVVVVTVLVLRHKPKKKVITGGVNSGANGMIVRNEKDRRDYALSGNMAAVKPGDRLWVFQMKNREPQRQGTALRNCTLDRR